MKLCCTCEHYRENDSGQTGCLRTERVDPVDGLRMIYSCDSERRCGLISAIFTGSCGHTGRFWRPSLRLAPSIESYLTEEADA